MLFRSLSILLAEDNPTNQFLIKSLLLKSACTVNIACNGLEAIKLLELHNFDIILMDVQMPIMDGIEATSRIRSLTTPPTLQQIPIIGITAHASEENTTSCLDAGMNQVLNKPLDPTLLFKTISNFVPQIST